MDCCHMELACVRYCLKRPYRGVHVYLLSVETRLVICGKLACFWTPRVAIVRISLWSRESSISISRYKSGVADLLQARLTRAAAAKSFFSIRFAIIWSTISTGSLMLGAVFSRTRFSLLDIQREKTRQEAGPTALKGCRVSRMCKVYYIRQ